MEGNQDTFGGNMERTTLLGQKLEIEISSSDSR
jgi:hypothetical protein